MANEATVNCSLSIRKGTNPVVMDYRSGPSNFRATVTGTKGPTPGAVTVSTLGTVIPFSELVTPGLCWIINRDPDNYVEYGIYDPETDVFYPWGELLPGELSAFRFSRNLHEEYTGTGTGTTAATNQVMFKANTADCIVSVEAFEQ